MAADLQSEDSGPIASINITPFVDVVLVLLVIFIITAPAIMKEVIGLNLPKATNVDQKAIASLGIAVTRQGQILLNGNLTTIEALVQEVRRAKETNPDTQVIIAADEDSRHGDVVKVIDTVKSAGITKFAIQIQKPI